MEAFYLSSIKQKNNKYLLFSKLSVRNTIFLLNCKNLMKLEERGVNHNRVKEGSKKRCRLR